MTRSSFDCVQKFADVALLAQLLSDVVVELTWNAWQTRCLIAFTLHVPLGTLEAFVQLGIVSIPSCWTTLACCLLCA